MVHHNSAHFAGLRANHHPDRPEPRAQTVSRYLTGACIEDVNHEIYGGLYSQMIFGESFQEPPAQPIEGFTAMDGNWSIDAGVLGGSASNGGKLILNKQEFNPNDVSVKLYFPNSHAGNAGLVLGVKNAAVGADRFDGLEVSLDPGSKNLRLARHHQDYQLILDAPCDLAVKQWIALRISRHGQTTSFFVNDKQVASLELPDDFQDGTIGLRTWNRPAKFRDLRISASDKTSKLEFEPPNEKVSGMWTIFRRGNAVGTASFDLLHPFVGSHSQMLIFATGEGEIGLENRGLNHQGINFQKDKPLQGHLWAVISISTQEHQSVLPQSINVSLSSADGKKRYATSKISVGDTNWHRCDFTLTPDTTDAGGRFEISLSSPGLIEIGYAFLEPGPWGTFKGLPVRADVAQGLIDQGITAMRYGGSMVNNDEYRWKKMIGDRDHRPPYHGLWYHESTNGWGIPDFLNFCEAAGFLPVVDFNINESPGDMVDFLEYANGPAESPWGAKRAADGHREPYKLTHIELGNEERVNDAYYRKFEALAKAIWAKDPG